jgi:hypothetical protein
VAGAIAGTDGAARLLAERGYAGPVAVIPQFGVTPERYARRSDARRRYRAAAGVGESWSVSAAGS